MRGGGGGGFIVFRLLSGSEKFVLVNNFFFPFRINSPLLFIA